MEFKRKSEITRAIVGYVAREAKEEGKTSCTLGEVVECQRNIPNILPLVSVGTGIPERELMEAWFEDFYEPTGTLQ